MANDEHIEKATAAATATFPTSFQSLQPKFNIFNLTRLPSAKDLVYLPLHLASRVDKILLQPFHQGNVAGMADDVQAVAGQIAAIQHPGAGAGAAAAPGWRQAFGEAFQLGNVKSYWGMLHYLTSRWAFATFSMALILNRVTVYGSTRHRIFLTWDKRLALRIIPIMLFLAQILRLLQAIQCQSSPEFSTYRYGAPDKYNSFDWATDSRFLYRLSSTLTFSSDRASCAANGMSRIGDARPRYGSFSLLWPTFLRLCLSHFVETISCALQQQPVMTDVGMSVFEHSLAFAEAETMISQMLGLGLFRSSSAFAKPGNMTLVASSSTTRAISDAATSLTGPHLLDRLNVPTEVLLIALLSSCNSLTANVIAVFNGQRSLRLINTGVWGLCFMTTFIWGFASKHSQVYSGTFGAGSPAKTNASGVLLSSNGAPPLDLRSVNGLLHFPTVCIVGFVPHLVVLLGITICACIYLLALVLTALSLNTTPFIAEAETLRQRFALAHDNLQAAIQVRGIQIKWDEDFYTALLRVGFMALTAASEAVFLNEGRSVEVRQFTWLEEERLDEVEASGWPRSRNSSTFQISEEYGLPGGFKNADEWRSGYAKERKLDKDKAGTGKSAPTVYPNTPPDGVGAIQRTTRFYLLFIFMRGIYFLIGGWILYGLGLFLDQIGLTGRPRWLRRIVGKSLKLEATKKERSTRNGKSRSLDFWLLTEAGESVNPRIEDLDIEPEMRRQLIMEHGDTGNVDELVDDKLYSWWKMGGWWGTVDSSGPYLPAEDVEDTTSVVSMSPAGSTTDENEDQDWESESEGRRTPTLRSPGPDLQCRTSTPAPFWDTPLDATSLARLLSPQDRASRDEARILAAHLATQSGILTRSKYRRELEGDRVRVLLAGRHLNSTAGSVDRPLSRTEECEVLESLILSRRQSRGSPTNAIAEDDGTSGPLCVVCQSHSRTIIAWPCRCLCVCEDCRISLALNNFSTCVTCRRQVNGFVRLWVP